MKPYYEDGQLALYHGKSHEILPTLDAGSVDCIVTSPPYFGLRDYGVDGQIGAESSPAEFVAALVAVFREARRVLADDGTLWLNLGDSYAGQGATSSRIKSASPQAAESSASSLLSSSDMTDSHSASASLARSTHSSSIGPLSTMKQGARNGNRRSRPRPYEGLPGKNLIGIPWRVAFALQDDGWILRNDIIWHKPNAMPESVTDRLSNRHEHLFLFSKKPRYWFDLDAVREPATAHTPNRHLSGAGSGRGKLNRDRNDSGSPVGGGDGLTRNPGDVWTIATQPFADAHFATFPPALPERCIQAGCKPGGTVLDPFSGSGTTGLAAARHGRKYVGIDLNRDYLDLSLRTRLAQPSLTVEAS